MMMALGMAVSAFSQSVKASYPGGEEAMQKYLAEKKVYPAAAKENGIEGVVSVAFIVKADGTIGSIKIVRMIDPDLEDESIRLVKGMPKWNPATEDGVAVDSKTEIEIPFLAE